MPIYEYTCTECGHRFEELVPAHRASKVRCPECGSLRAERAFSVFAAHSEAGPAANAEGGCCSCGDAGGPCSL